MVSHGAAAHPEEVLSLIEPKLSKMHDTQLRILLDDAHGTLHLKPIMF